MEMAVVDECERRTIPYTGTWGVVTGKATGAGAWEVDKHLLIQSNTDHKHSSVLADGKGTQACGSL